MRRIRLYSLRTINDRSTLSFDLNGIVTAENKYSIEIETPKGKAVLNHSEYLNKEKIYDDGDIFFMVCTKRINQKYAFKLLMKYALEKVDKILEDLANDEKVKKFQKFSNFKGRLQSELIAA